MRQFFGLMMKVDDHDRMEMMSFTKAKSAETGKRVSSLESVNPVDENADERRRMISGKWKFFYYLWNGIIIAISFDLIEASLQVRQQYVVFSKAHGSFSVFAMFV
jgi:hypothetical protein